METTYLIWAFSLGAIAAGSMVLGSIVGIYIPMSNSRVGAMCGFGAGALFSALALELVSPTVEVMALAQGAGRVEAAEHFVVLLVALIVGGGIFITVDQIISNHGGYLRKGAYVIAQHTRNKARRKDELIRSIANSSFFGSLPDELVKDLVTQLHPRFLIKGETLFDSGDASSEFYIVRDGVLTISRSDGGSHIAERGDLVGEISFLAHSDHTSKAVASLGSVELLVLHKKQYDHLAKEHPELVSAVKAMAARRIEENLHQIDQTYVQKQDWANIALEALTTGGAEIPSASEVKAMKEEHSNAGMAIWLGNLLDVIPDGFVVGTVMLATVAHAASTGTAISFIDVVPLTLVGALFLSNFPEALAASVNMKQQGFSTSKIIFLWVVLTGICAIVSSFGAYVGETIPHSYMIFVEGIAAGAMLTMIGSAMLPEAAHLSSPNVAGFSTLLGFVAAVGFKLFE